MFSVNWALRLPLSFKPRETVLYFSDPGCRLPRIELEWLPSFPVIHTLVDCDGVWFRGVRTELQTDVGQFILLSQAQGQRDVVGRSVNAGWRLQGIRSPTGHVVRVVQVRQVWRWKSARKNLTINTIWKKQWEERHSSRSLVGSVSKNKKERPGTQYKKTLFGIFLLN